LAKQANLSKRGTETVVAALWQEVLQVPQTLSADDNFFELGGDSIAMVTVLFRIQEELAVELPPDTLFSASTLGELAAVVDAAA
jgi:acyl carrier protein